MQLVAYGVNHTTAPVDIRENIAFSPEALPEALTALKAEPGVVEAVIVSTCNRTEIYCHLEDDNAINVSEWLHQYHQAQANTLDNYPTSGSLMVVVCDSTENVLESGPSLDLVISSASC